MFLIFYLLGALFLSPLYSNSLRIIISICVKIQNERDLIRMIKSEAETRLESKRESDLSK